MNVDVNNADYQPLTGSSKQVMQFNPFVGHECVLKKCCKKYKKSKRCKKCPD